ncbi:MAG TPA: dihydrofolate reductase family protein [Patescibacteria group bacterium]
MEVYLLAAQTIDGFIARHKDDRSFDWTSPEDKQFYVSKIKEADAIVIGRTTFETFSRHPKNSRWILYTSQPEKFTNPKPEVIQAEATDEDPRALIERLRKEGCQKVAISGGSSIYALFMEAGVIDTLYLTIEPVLFGEGIKLFSQPLPNSTLQLKKVHPLGEHTIVLEYSTRG